MSLSKPLTLRHLCHLLNNILGLFYHRHIVFLIISLVKNTKCYEIFTLEITFKRTGRTCPECKKRYAISIHVLRPCHRVQFFLNLQRYSALVRCKIGKCTFPSQFANIFLTYQTFVTNLHLLKSRIAHALQVAREIAPCDRVFSA